MTSRNTKRERLLRGARTLTHRQGWYTMAELADSLPDLQDPFSSHRGLVSDAIGDGELVVFSGGRGTRYAARTAENLLDVLHLAQGCVDNSKADREAGRKAPQEGEMERTSNFRSVEYISDVQLKRAWSAAKKIARWLDPDAAKGGTLDVLRTVGGDQLLWSSTGGPGDLGHWEGIAELVAAATVNLAASTRSEYRSRLNKVMYLAATHGWIPGPDMHPPESVRIPADWADTWNEWRDSLLEDSQALKFGITGALRWLFRGLRLLGVEDPNISKAEWDRIVPELEMFLHRTGISAQRKSDVRRIYRLLRKQSLIQGPDWRPRTARGGGVGIFHHSFNKRMAQAYGSERSWEHSKHLRQEAWNELPRSLSGLRDPRYGLPALLTFLSVPSSDAKTHGVPPRDARFKGLDNGVPGNRKGRWAKSTIETTLEKLGLLMGHWSRLYDVSWREHDLRALCDPQKVVDLTHGVIRGDVEMKRRTLADALSVVSRIAFPLVVHAAERELKDANDVGDDARIQDLRSLITNAKGVFEVLRVGQDTSPTSSIATPGILNTVRSTNSLSHQRMQAEKLEDAYSRGVLADQSFKFSYQAIHAVRMHEEDRARANMTVQTWRDLESEVAEGRCLTLEEARTVRDLLLPGILQVVPLRRTPLSSIKTHWVVETPHGFELRIRRYASKEQGKTDTIDMPDDQYEAEWEVYNLYHDDPHPSTLPDQELPDVLDPALLRVYLMPGGAWEVLGRHLGIPSSPYLWLPDRWTRVGVGEKQSEPRITPSSLTTRFGHFRELAANLLTIDPSSMKGIHPLHSFRHSFGTFFVRNEKATLAQKHLGHKDISTTLKIYADQRPQHQHPNREAAILLARL